MYRRPLKVSTPEGKRIIAMIFRSGSNVHIIIDSLKEVKKDNPSFANKDGKILLIVPIEKYADTIELLTKYIEDLFLKGMSDENTRTGLGSKSKSRGIKESGSGGKTKKFEGERRDSSIHARARRDESAESSRRRKSTSKMAESGDSESSGKD